MDGCLPILFAGVKGMGTCKVVQDFGNPLSGDFTTKREKTLEQARFFYVKNVAAMCGRLPNSPMLG
jgi:hypothetical protein